MVERGGEVAALPRRPRRQLGPADPLDPGAAIAVRRQAGGNSLMGNPGDFFWGGAAGTYMMGDPAEHMFVVWMLQAPKKNAGIRGTLRNMIYGAIDESRVPAN
ncbi:MAG: hypothetical protein KDC48_18710 [Planctomycetes bacterium]|nr:hypothetical protein [Planctomycetota bacterium]